MHFEAIIQNSQYKTDVKDKLLQIKNILLDMDYFGRKEIADGLSVSTRTSSNLIEYLKTLDLITEVKGHGRGKYKFK